MLTNLAVAAAFRRYTVEGKKEPMVQYKYCYKAPFAKHTSRQRTHLTVCAGYLAYQREQNRQNEITRRAAQQQLQQPLFQIISPDKRKQLDKLFSLAAYCEGLPLGFFEGRWMHNAFVQGFGYKPPVRDRMSETLLDEAYMDTKDKVETILKESPLLNVISDESDNVKGERILNMTVLTKDHHAFYAFSESAGDKRLDAAENARWMLAKMLELTGGDLGKIHSVTTDTCSLERATWDRLSQDPRLSHIFYVSCDSHGLQLLIKNLLSAPQIKTTFYKGLAIVNFLRKAKHQLSILRRYQTQHYGGPRSLIASTILRWGTQVTMLESVANSKAALRSYVEDPEAKFPPRRNGTPNRTKEYVQNHEFWVELDELITLL